MSFFLWMNRIRIPFETISIATKGFTTMIGSGGNGDVYKGELPHEGKIIRIAVKRLPGVRVSDEQRDQFFRELAVLTTCSHPNIVNLVGFCSDENTKTLHIVYEYAEGGSLDYHLNTVCGRLTWKQRIKICIDVACGLDYYHNRGEELIHRDIKSANILLDRNMKAMIGDFGLSTTADANKEQADQQHTVSGTPGYWDPEYIKTGILTSKSDVYSFGVVLFEVLCGRLCFKNVIGEQRYLVPLARRCYEEGRLNEIMDLDLKDLESMKEFSKIANHCVNDDPEGRPSMDLVLQKLKKVLELHELNEASELQEQGEQLSELQDIRILPTSLASQAFGVNNDQQWVNQLPSEGSVRPIQRSSINQLQKTRRTRMERILQKTRPTVPRILKPDGKTDDQKLLSLTDFGYPNRISNNQDQNMISEYDDDGQPFSVGVLARDRFSNLSIVGDPYIGDKAPISLSDVATRPQLSQTGVCLKDKENDDDN